MRTPAFLLCAILFGTTLRAQSLPERAHEQTYVMANGNIVGSMDLDTAQVRRLATAERHFDQDYDRLMANDTLTEEEMARRVEALAQRRQTTIRAILTPEQYAKWSRLLADAPME